MAAVVTERIRRPYTTEKTSTYTERITAQRTFDVSGVADENAAFTALLAAYTSPAVNYGDPHPQDDDTTVVSHHIERITPGSSGYFTITVNYNSESGDSANILLTPPEIRYDPYTYEVAADRDLDGVPYLNTAGFPFDIPLPLEKQGVILTVKKWKASYSIAEHLQFAGKVNDGSFTWPGAGTSVAAGQAKCLGIFQGERSTSSSAVMVEYRFDLREEGHQHNVVDQGPLGWAVHDGVKKTGVFVGGNKAGVSPTGPIRLDGTGRPLLSNDFYVLPAQPYAGDPINPATPPTASPSSSLVNSTLSSSELTVLTFRNHLAEDFSDLSL